MSREYNGYWTHTEIQHFYNYNETYMKTIVTYLKCLKSNVYIVLE